MYTYTCYGELDMVGTVHDSSFQTTGPAPWWESYADLEKQQH